MARSIQEIVALAIESELQRKSSLTTNRADAGNCAFPPGVSLARRKSS